MKKILVAALLVPMAALAQTYPSPTFNTLTLQTPLTAANGGTGATTSTGTGSVVLSNGPTFTTLSSSGLATLYGITTPSTGNFYQGQGASITRINDRLFVAGATSNNGTQAASQPDWLTTFQLSTGRANGFIQLANFAVLNGSNPQNQEAMVVAAQSATNTLSGGAIGAVLMGINNNTSVTGSVWGAYIEAYRMAGVSGGADGLEIDTANFSGPVTLDPYQQNVAQTIGLQLASGAELPPTGQYPSQAAINIQNNNSTFDNGIVFGSNSLTSGLAIAFSSGQRMQWFGGAGIPISSIVGTGTTQAAGTQQIFSDNQVNWLNTGGNPLFSAINTTNGVNYVQAANNTAGNAPAVQAQGADANVTLNLVPKGTGSVQVTSAATSGTPFIVSAVNNPSGAQIFLAGNGATTPNKYLRATNGNFQIVNSADSAALLTLTDAGLLSTTGGIQPSSTAGIIGTTTNNNANAGSVGEHVSNSATGVSLTSSTATNVTSISLTAGDWDVSGTVTFVPNASTTIAQLEAGTSATSATFGGLGSLNLLTLPFTTGQNQVILAPTQRISIASTTTVYLVGFANFGVSTMTANGFIRARRAR